MSKQIDPNILQNERFPRSNKYDPLWIFDNQMGPHPLWLAEFLTQSFDLNPGMRVLDLGCGRGITSVFLAREFGVQVYAVDLWGGPDEKWQNAKLHGVENLITPVYADARDLPFAQGFFDAIVSVDSYFYFGHEDGYLENILKFLRPGGKIGMIVPGYMNDIDIPDYMEEYDDGSCAWKTLLWWKNLWEKTGLVTIDTADTLPDGCALWLRFDKALLAAENCKNGTDATTNDDIELLGNDNGEYIGFVRLIATKK